MSLLQIPGLESRLGPRHCIDVLLPAFAPLPFSFHPLIILHLSSLVATVFVPQVPLRGESCPSSYLRSARPLALCNSVRQARNIQPTVDFVSHMQSTAKLVQWVLSLKYFLKLFTFFIIITIVFIKTLIIS